MTRPNRAPRVPESARIVAINGSSPAEFRFRTGTVSIGSEAANSLVLGAATVSRRHAKLELRGGEGLLTDSGSTNGTFVNGQRITEPTAVRDGDEIRFGSVRCVFRLDSDNARSGGGPVGGGRWRRIRPTIAVTGLLIAASLGYLLVSCFSGIERGSDRSGAPSRNGSEASVRESPSRSNAGNEQASLHAPWLDVLNQYRTSVGVSPVRGNPELSAGAALHSRYLFGNYADDVRRGVNLGRLMHTEDPSKPLFTKQGLAAGQASDVDEMWNPGSTPAPGWAIDDWMRGPFHRLSLLNPYLHSVGYGDSCDKSVCIATLNAQTDTEPLPPSPRPLASPLEYPASGASIRAISFEPEWPDPLTSCPGYVAADAGLPITIEFGPLVVPGISRVTLSSNVTPPAVVEACVLDANTYTNPDGPTQRLARDILRNYGAVVIVPRHKLAPGVYTVSVATGDQDVTWSFSVKA